MRTQSMTVIAAALAWVAALLSIVGCGAPQSRVHRGMIGEVIDQTPDRGSFYEAVGIGASDPDLPTVTQRKALARDAAIAKAQYELMSLVKGVKLEGGVTVSQAMEEDSELTARVDDVIRGAAVVKSEFTGDGGCVATVRLPKAALAQAAGGRP